MYIIFTRNLQSPSAFKILIVAIPDTEATFLTSNVCLIILNKEIVFLKKVNVKYNVHSRFL